MLTNASVNYTLEALRFFVPLRMTFVYLFLLFPYTFLLAFSAGGRKGMPSIIGRTCVFDAKIYKIVDALFNVSAYVEWNKK